MSDAIGVVTVRYWAAARAAAGCDVDDVPLTGTATLADVLDEVRRRHDGRFASVLGVCSLLVDERPQTGDPAGVAVSPGAVVDVLPPFAGG